MTMRYIPNRKSDQDAMLKSIGKSSMDDLFASVPSGFAYAGSFKEPARSDQSLEELFNRASHENVPVTSFMGAGAYSHYTPKIIPYLLSRPEFVTAYTPYQPEISQGTLQGIFEFQSLVCQLFNMDVANASMYDGVSATAESILLAIRHSKKNHVILSGGIHPHYEQVIRTYVSKDVATLAKTPLTKGITDISKMASAITDKTACVVVQYPNFLGAIEPLADIRTKIGKDVMLIVVVTEPLSLGVLKSPGDFGADIVCGEGQSLGLPLHFGGPYLGLLAVKQQYLWQMPGRLVGETKDPEGNRRYLLTLSTREQHIKREKATSNICSNQSLCALGAGMYLAVLGKQGFKEVSETNATRAHEFKKLLLSFSNLFDDGITASFFNEFTLKVKNGLAHSLYEYLLSKNIVLGVPLSRFDSSLNDYFVINVTESHTDEDFKNVKDALTAFKK